MIEGGKGGSNTQSGLEFEERIDIVQAINTLNGYDVNDDKEIFFDGEKVARSIRKYNLYQYLEDNDVNWKEVVSKRLLPDEAILVYETSTLYIIEMKFQKVPGSVDEKLQTCDFKKKQYQKLMETIDFDVEYFYILNDWFKDDKYDDVRGYIKEVGCDFFYEELPLNQIGLPKPKSDPSNS